MPIQHIENNEIASSVREKLNNSIDQVNSLGEDIKNVRYTNDVPTPTDIGGIKKGTTFDNLTIGQILDDLLYPYTVPTVELVTSPDPKVLREYGDSISQLTLTTVISKGSSSNLTATFKRGEEVIGTLPTSGFNVTFTYKPNLPLNEDATFTVELFDEKSTAVSKEVFYDFAYPYYCGISNTDSVDEATIKASTKVLQLKDNVNPRFTCANAHPFFAFPPDWGNVIAIYDTNKFNITDSFNQSKVSITTNDGKATEYNCYTLKTATTINDYTIYATFKPEGVLSCVKAVPI